MQIYLRDRFVMFIFIQEHRYIDIDVLFHFVNCSIVPQQHAHLPRAGNTLRIEPPIVNEVHFDIMDYPFDSIGSEVVFFESDLNDAVSLV